MTFFAHYKSGYKICIKLTPNAKNSEIKGVLTDANGEEFLKISLNAVPEKGKANQELLKFLAKKLQFSKSDFSILSGLTDHYKKIYINVPQTVENDNKIADLQRN